MNTARYRCSACGEPLVRPALSCPYCGAFRSAVPLSDADDAGDVVQQGPPRIVAKPLPGYERHDAVVPEDEEPTNLAFAEADLADEIEAPDTFAEAEPEPPLATPVEEPPAPAPQIPREPREARPARRRAAPELRAVPQPRRPARSAQAPAPGGRRVEPSLGPRPSEAAPSQRARRIGTPGAPRHEPVPPAPEAPEPGALEWDDAPETAESHADAALPETPAAEPEAAHPAAPSEPHAQRGQRNRRASAQRRTAPRPPVPPRPDGAASIAVGPSIDDVLREVEDTPRKKGRSLVRAAGADGETLPVPARKRRRGGFVALLIVLLVLLGGAGAGYYWLEQQGIIDMLRSDNLTVTRLGEAQPMSVPASWTRVPDPGAGGAVGMLLSATGPFRARVDGTVYTFDGSSPVRVPVRTSTALELRGLDGPVTVDVTRLGEEPAGE